MTKKERALKAVEILKEIYPMQSAHLIPAMRLRLLVANAPFRPVHGCKGKSRNSRAFCKI
jgi:hypothetical protein